MITMIKSMMKIGQSSFGEIIWAKLLTPVLLGLSFVETSEHIALSFSFSTLKIKTL